MLATTVDLSLPVIVGGLLAGVLSAAGAAIARSAWRISRAVYDQVEETIRLTANVDQMGIDVASLRQDMSRLARIVGVTQRDVRDMKEAGR